MAETPKPKSYDQVNGDMLSTFMSKTGLNDLNTGSITTSIFETVALAIARSSGDIFQVLRDLSVDRAEGDALRKLAKDEGLRELPARVASGEVTISDSSFSKKSTKIYAGANAPNVGSTTILLSDASSFSPTGSVYIGRGTPNVEGPISYTSIVSIGSYYQMTLASPTTKFHNINEAVVQAQGGVRTIPAGTVVRAPASGPSPDINFTVTIPAIILDGETEISGVQVSAQEPGTVGNIPIGAIREFSAPPFAGASVSNSLPFKTGRDVETDEEIRIRIKRARLSKGLGTSLAVKSAVIGASPSDENSTVVSSEITTSGGQTILYVDDNTGYEEKSDGVGIEVLTNSALGGEDHFQLETGGRQSSVIKAFLLSNLSGPFDVAGTDRLAITVGGNTTEHIFQTSDFISPGGATADEIVASINANTSLGFSASTSEGSTKVMIFAKAEEDEHIQIADVSVGRNVADLIELPTNEVQTLRLFKNKKPLSKDGRSASVKSARQVDWSPSIATGDTLVLSVDGTAPITYTFTDADFIAEGSHVTVSNTNSLESWINVFNSKLTGITASIVGEQIVLTSNLGASNRAKVEIDISSTLAIKGMFTVSVGLEATGIASDYLFSRNTAQIKLSSPLSAGDQLTAGTEDTEGRLEASAILGGTLSLALDGYFWILVDDQEASIVQTGAVANTTFSISKPSANIIRFTSSNASAFANVQVGDYLIVWSSELNSANRLEGRVNATTSSTIDLKVTASEYASAVLEAGVLFQEGFIVLRTSKVPNKLKISAGTKTLNEIADELNSQISSASFSVFDEEILIVKTKNKNTSGSVLFVTADASAKSLGFTDGDEDTSNESLFAFYESSYEEGSFPFFFHDKFSTDSFANPPNSFISSVNSTLSPSSFGLDPSYLISYLQPYGAILDTLSISESSALDSQSGITLNIEDDYLVRRVRSGDRWFASSPLDFGHDDEIVAVIDGDASNKTFSIPFYRKALTNPTLAVNPTSFNAYDYDAGPTSAFTTFFDASFKFDNYKALMKAKNVLDPSGSQDAILFRSALWGRSGEKMKVGYIYPTSPNSGISHTITIDDKININISLKSGAVVPTSIDGTTEWDITIAPNTPVAGVDQVTFTWNGNGTNPGLGALAGGEYVTISNGSELSSANLGTFRVSTEIGFTPTATSFTVVRENGSAISELAIATLVASVFTFFAANSTTASDIVSYVSGSSSLSSFISASIVNDGGLAGTGIISKSTFEESDFSFDSVELKDGLNWIATSNIGGSPQFSFKKSLDLPTATGYAFNDGEEIRIVPTTVKQLSEFLNVLAVTGLTTLGTINLTNRDKKLEIATQTLGGEGSIQIVGGRGNSNETPILGSSISIDNTYTLASVSKAGLDGFHSDQWVKLEATNKQTKDILLKGSGSIRIQSNYPTTGESTVTLYNRELNSRHFGKPRHHTRTQGRVFKVEKQGSFACISWDGVGTNPFFQKAAELDDSLGGTVNVEKIAGTSEARYVILTGNTNFSEISIGDLVTVQNMEEESNNGSFLVTGVSSDGKSLRVLNASSVNEFSTATFSITNNADIAGDDFIVNGNVLTAGIDFVIGGSAAITAQNLAAAISILPGVVAESNSNVVLVTADAVEASISISYVNNAGAAGATVSSAFLVGTSFVAGDFSCSLSVSEGDTVSIGAPFNLLNRGNYRVIRRFQNSIYVDNDKAIEEYITLSLNSISLGFDGTTQFDIDGSQNKIKMSWNGIGTAPTLESLLSGDEITLGTDFASGNQGTFMVTKAEASQKEEIKIKLPAGNLITGGQRFHINSANDSTLYYVWFKVDGIGVDPAPGGRVGILASVSSASTASQVATIVAAAIDASADFVAIAESSYVRITNSGFGPCTDAVNVDLSGSPEFMIVQQGQWTFFEAINPKATNDSSVLITDTLQAHRPAILFKEYEASIEGDQFLVMSNFLGSSNQDSWKIKTVIDQDKIIVEGTMASLDQTTLAGNETNLMVEEQSPYIGYKKIVFITIDPANYTLRGLMLFDTMAQANRINESAAVQISSINKVGFSETFRRGLDSYRYHTGLIGESNRIVYGDPRDNTTYAGVAAAGAEIFIKAPLRRRIQVSVAVRLETGIPFAQIVDQVRTNLSALIGSNPIGQAIAISDIVSSVNSIPGVKAMAVSSPQYDASHDTINIGPSEKARIIDPIRDIIVSQLG